MLKLDKVVTEKPKIQGLLEKRVQSSLSRIWSRRKFVSISLFCLIFKFWDNLIFIVVCSICTWSSHLILHFCWSYFSLDFFLISFSWILLHWFRFLTTFFPSGALENFYLIALGCLSIDPFLLPSLFTWPEGWVVGSPVIFHLPGPPF